MAVNRQLRNGAAALGFSLVSLLGGCPYKVDVTGENVPASNPTFGQNEQLCEDNLQKEPIVFSYAFNENIGSFDVEIAVDPENPEASQPIRLAENSVLVRDTGDGTRRLEGIIEDVPDVEMNRGWRSGEIVTLTGKVYSPNGELICPINGLAYAENPNFSFQHHYTVIRGPCDIGELGNQIDVLTNDLRGHENSPVPPEHPGTNIPTTQPSFVSGDGNCETDKGENYLNSSDCAPPWISGDGICSPGEPADSLDCVVEPPIKPTINNQKDRITIQIYEGSIQLPNVDYLYPISLTEGTTRTLTARLTMPSELESQMLQDGYAIPTAVIRELGYGPETQGYNPLRELNEIFIGSVQPAVRVTPGIYDTQFKLRDELLSLQLTEEIDASYYLSDSSGTIKFSDAVYFSE